ncbi:MAG: Uma2 family endonuclease [Pirellulales bacterium]
MATADTTLPTRQAQRLFTAADLQHLPINLPSGPIDYELDNGKLVPLMAPPGDIHSSVQSNLIYLLKQLGEIPNHGKVRCEVGIVLWRDPDRVVGADVAFIARKSLPIRRTSEGYLETIPELVVEIRSKNDSLADLSRKVEDYLKAGVQIAIVAEPHSKTVTIHTPDSQPVVLRQTDSLQLPESLIPGFSVPVDQLFCD